MTTKRKKNMRASFAFALVLATLCVVFFAYGTSAESADNQACGMCKNINMGREAGWVCPKSVVKECNVNMNGWCCKGKREHPKCKQCSGGKAYEADDDDDDDEDDE